VEAALYARDYRQVLLVRQIRDFEHLAALHWVDARGLFDKQVLAGVDKFPDVQGPEHGGSGVYYYVYVLAENLLVGVPTRESAAFGHVYGVLAELLGVSFKSLYRKVVSVGEQIGYCDDFHRPFRRRQHVRNGPYAAAAASDQPDFELAFLTHLRRREFRQRRGCRGNRDGLHCVSSIHNVSPCMR